MIEEPNHVRSLRSETRRWAQHICPRPSHIKKLRVCRGIEGFQKAVHIAACKWRLGVAPPQSRQPLRHSVGASPMTSTSIASSSPSTRQYSSIRRCTAAASSSATRMTVPPTRGRISCCASVSCSPSSRLLVLCLYHLFCFCACTLLPFPRFTFLGCTPGAFSIVLSRQ